MSCSRPKLLIVLILAVAPNCALSTSRGPHHPRSQVVSHTHYRPQRGQVAGDAYAHAHDLTNPPPKLTQDTELLHDAEHIREDLGEWVTKEQTRRMSPEELEFHYFKIHDVDNNTKLDGLEILQAILHTVHYNEDHEESQDGADKQTKDTPAKGLPKTPELFDGNGEHGTASAGAGVKQDSLDDFDYFVELIDRVLAEDDQNQDGYLSYVEYVVGRQRDETKRVSSAGAKHVSSRNGRK